MQGIYEKTETFGMPESRFITEGPVSVVSPLVQTPLITNRSYPGQQQSEDLSSIGARAVILGHELANSLNVISSALQFLDMELGKKQSGDRALTVTIGSALEEVDRLASMLDEFRSPVRLQTCDLVRGDLVKLIEEIVILQTLVCRPQGISVTFESDDAIPPINLNATKLKQLVLNLCKNAAEAMPEGGELALKVYRSDDSIALDISDNGIGIAHNPNTFGLFKTTKLGGSGIGLSVVQQIVSEHNGTITCISNAGHGTSFKILFPAAD